MTSRENNSTENNGAVKKEPTGFKKLFANVEAKKIVIPEDKPGFSFRKLWAFSGPGLLMSIAYLDPGNIESSLQSGGVANYKLLWLLLLATVLGLVVQRLSARLSVVTGHHLAQMAYKQFPTVPRLILWVMVEVAIIGSDMQEVIGTSLALYLLSNKTIPLYAGVLITIVDTFTFLGLDRYGLRKLEVLFAFLIGVMAMTFGYEYVVAAPDQGLIMKGMFFPYCENCSSDVLLQAVGIIGAVIMPHNLYLHSALVKSREIDRTKRDKIRDANLYTFIEGAIALVIAFIINVFVVGVFAKALYGQTNNQIHDLCVNENSTFSDIFPSNDELVDADIYNGGVILGCHYGVAAMYIWAVGILAAGQSSTMTGCYSGQFAMEGFLNLEWARWKRVLFTRAIAITPTFFVAFFSEIDNLSGMNDILNAVMSLQLPFAILPTIAFTCSHAIMGEFKNGIFTIIVSTILAVIVLGINFFFVGYSVSEDLPHDWYYLLLIVAYAIFYVVMCLYFIIYVILVLGGFRLLKNYPIVTRLWFEPKVMYTGSESFEKEEKDVDSLSRIELP